MDLKESEILKGHVERHWYYRSKCKALKRLIHDVKPSIILDVGAGSGFFSKRILAETHAKEAWCVDTGYDADSDEVVAGKPVHFRRTLTRSDAELVLLMDVLEHVDDDVGLLADYVQKVPRGAKFLMSVPAFPFLWSGHDVFLEHRRRYKINQLEDVARGAGLTVVRSAYYFGTVFPIAAAIRISSKLVQKGQYVAKSQLTEHHPVVNECLAALSSAELPFILHNRIGGLTVFCLAEKQ